MKEKKRCHIPAKMAAFWLKKTLQPQQYKSLQRSIPLKNFVITGKKKSFMLWTVY
jgi:hypothetical protein